jgi:putative transposase
MSNHNHRLVKTPDANLRKGMRQLNGIYTQTYNRRHQKTGHLFQWLYKSILVDGDNYLTRSQPIYSTESGQGRND